MQERINARMQIKQAMVIEGIVRPFEGGERREGARVNVRIVLMPRPLKFCKKWPTLEKRELEPLSKYIYSDEQNRKQLENVHN
jgi:hypothetical protein